MTDTARDRRFMAAAIRLARLHEGRTGSNPSVATLIVRETADGPVIVGSGVTAVGGRPHAEPQALAQAGELARGATAYVTLEPCAHHGRTPPCADTLVTAGIARVVGAAADPDPRVSGKGYAILRSAGIEVEEHVLADEAAAGLAGYLTRRISNRAHVTLKLAVSANGMIGLKGKGQVALTGPLARRQVHVTRARSDVILVGSATAVADDPELTVRLAGLEERSPIRLVLDENLRLPVASKLVRNIGQAPLWIATSAPPDDPARMALAEAGAEFIAADVINNRIALPELLEDVAQRGLSTVMVEGGAAVAGAFLAEGLVDRLQIYTSTKTVAGEGVAAPVTAETVPAGFVRRRTDFFGEDRFDEFERLG
ncbi:bifunctional diaminohydroxyphosphoribosylaminopyrimidine deaminase/5-amino-6-(5-phosphoribosylamino)uracil reductase RibD [Pseudohoeflea suaedae]|uniref:Riboflavin biosynthesis protein RibD n=1 Tax=Pseudohoeflea suaedae TaxID=877384 RepID=A0A4R5PQQ6_9HYPH|nr:bifunctional diaminohydroxyphosphoribosylaminopyrimidine deaminase/5-amino-6-(5-phosphoribosylamino)uracil reductase RibD [Pseudohoeflea suaedae]TDH38967.1 bifunctional diaminohydroxyphosphoribosylaminopyrimidine deaminase/5-amino-6-(5-phosphoribosylamino)uracil reductase RibD [Pseudohoeflea suaedae]